MGNKPIAEMEEHFDPFTQYVYLSVLGEMCESAVVESERWIAAETRESTAELFRAIHAFLIHSGGASRMLWPTAQAGPLGATRGQLLRRLLQVSDASPLNSRNLRNRLEHFDENLDKWAISLDRIAFADRKVGPVAQSIIEAEHGQVPAIRNFDPATWTFSFRADHYDLRAIRDAIEELAHDVARHLQELEAYVFGVGGEPQE